MKDNQNGRKTKRKVENKMEQQQHSVDKLIFFFLTNLVEKQTDSQLHEEITP